jgi:hypothetical protein
VSIESVHPEYSDRAPDWEVLRDTYRGQRWVKSLGFKYLKPTGGQVEDGVMYGREPGKSAYEAYLSRAILPGLVSDAVAVLVGVMHRKPAMIHLPAELEPMREKATRKGETLEQLLRKINEEQLLVGRYGLLADAPSIGMTPYIVPYKAEAITNWDDELVDGPTGEFVRRELNFLVLREDVPVRGENGAAFDWDVERRFRVCRLVTNLTDTELGTKLDLDVADDQLVYTSYVEYDEARGPVVVPAMAGRTLNVIPFTVIGANDLCLTPDDPPLLALAELTLSIYRSEADLRQTTFMLGQDTLVIIGEEVDEAGEVKQTTTRVGAGAKISVQQGGDAKFIGVNGDGLPEQRRILADDYGKAREAGSRLLEPRAGQAESGEALKVRVAAQTASLHQIALTGAAGLERCLKQCAVWVGADPNEVKVTPNLDFSDANEKPSSLRDLMDAKAKGAPISLESIHGWASDNGLTKLTFEEELERLEEEAEKAEIMALSRATAGAVAKTDPGTETEVDENGDPVEESEDDEPTQSPEERRAVRERRRTGETPADRAARRERASAAPASEDSEE